ncbi:3-hydroxyacyl-CoA dehydrogenase [Streptomyces sp. TRM66268-LWL]|uniref:3-hydroxyacyl-CoA dehydrogenase n=2 Tax=Streptomyces polyasparticus TaxID=2767826 RepID=A0ABR7SQB0_9ACTN|nr:3-hydroxyacyl-CoA dehydrogenase [Streptomyces polyasparticus]
MYRYPAADDVERAVRRLAEEHPRLLRLREVGRSGDGRALWLLSAGHGSRDVLTVAGAHANEPVGGASVLELARRFVRDPRWLAERDCTWHALLCLDPDGARRHEGLEGPSLLGYHLGFYRPNFTRQPEFLPGAGDGRPPMPESRALMGVLDELRPVVQFSLHGNEVGGSFVQLTAPLTGAGQAFRDVAAELAVPWEFRPFDGIDWLVDGPGVLRLPAGGQEQEEKDPSGFLSRATWTYPARYGTVSVVVEAPMWAAPAVSDPTPVADPAAELRKVGDLLLGRLQQVSDALAGVPEPSSPYQAAARELLDVAPEVAVTWREYAPGGSGIAATAGSGTSMGIAARRIPLRAAAMMRRALLAEGRTAQGRTATARTAGAARALEWLMREWCAELATEFRAAWVPVATQVALQTRVMREIVASASA